MARKRNRTQRNSSQTGIPSKAAAEHADLPAESDSTDPSAPVTSRRGKAGRKRPKIKERSLDRDDTVVADLYADPDQTNASKKPDKRKKQRNRGRRGKKGHDLLTEHVKAISENDFVTSSPVQPTHAAASAKFEDDASSPAQCSSHVLDGDEEPSAFLHAPSSRAAFDHENDNGAAYNKLFVASNPKAVRETVSWVHLQRDLGRVDDHPIKCFFLGEADMTVPINIIHRLLEICKPSFLTGLELGSSRTQDRSKLRRRAWRDDRASSGNGRRNHRVYSNPLSQRGLFRSLNPKIRFGAPGQPDANRRLIYVEGLDGPYIFALTETAVQHQVPALRDAIGSHLGYRTNFSVDVPPREPIFRISMYMNFPVLITPKTLEQKPDGSRCLNSSFANRHRNNSDSHVSEIYMARTTIEICGFEYQKYTVWAFVDPLKGESIEEREADEFPYDEPSEVDSCIHEDPIASGHPIDANQPIMDARDYALEILWIKTRKSAKLWRDVIGIHEQPLRAHEGYVGELSSHSDLPERKKHQTVKEAYLENQEWTKLLSELESELSRFIDSLGVFLEKDGGIDFLRSDATFAPYRHASRVTAIHQFLRSHKDSHRTLKVWLESCLRISNQLDLWLKLEANERSVQNTNTTMVTVQLITPVMVAIGLCSMNENFIPFSMNRLSLVVTIVVTFAIFAGLQIIVSKIQDNPKWWPFNFAYRWSQRAGRDGRSTNDGQDTPAALRTSEHRTISADVA